jgi:hypothetical protein
MPLKKVMMKPGVNRENTRYTTEGGWYSCDKVRFRQGTPEKIGGWNRISSETYLGICRSLWAWSTLAGYIYVGVGTNLKFYIQDGGVYFDVTPYRTGVISLTSCFTTDGTTTVQVTDVAHGCITGDFVHITNVSGAVNGIPAASLQGMFQVTVLDDDNYTIVSPVTATSSGTPAVNADVQYEINTGSDIQVSVAGWGVGGWGLGGWGVGFVSSNLRLWSQSNFGEDLIFGPQGGGIYYWDASAGTATRAVALSSMTGASDVPTIQSLVLVSDISRFVFAFGCNDYGSASQDLMLVRWSDQENAVNWTPSATNQAGSLRLSRGSQIITATQARQEVLVWTDAALYSLQNLGAPTGWGGQLVGENISIVGQNAVAYANGVAYWMGVDKFYMYKGTTETLTCNLRQFIFSDINQNQFQQVCAGTNEGFNEIWWFYPSGSSTVIDRYVVYNYEEKIWYYGSLGRTAWLDSGLLVYPLAATYVNNLVDHEFGVDDNSTSETLPIAAYIESSETDLDDGDNFMFIRRVLPDVTFRGSGAASPSGLLTLKPLANSGSGYLSPASVGGTSSNADASVVRSATVPVEAFTGQVYIRLRGRQIVIRFESSDIGVQWQLGALRIDMQMDGRGSGYGVNGGP